jgi:hypothetical protein
VGMVVDMGLVCGPSFVVSSPPSLPHFPQPKSTMGRRVTTSSLPLFVIPVYLSIIATCPCVLSACPVSVFFWRCCFVVLCVCVFSRVFSLSSFSLSSFSPSLSPRLTCSLIFYSLTTVPLFVCVYSSSLSLSPPSACSLILFYS